MAEIARVAEKKRSLKVRNGDTLMSIMLSAGIARDDAHDAVSALRTVYDPRDLRVGQRIQFCERCAVAQQPDASKVGAKL